MDDKTKAALEGSIEKWKAIVAGTAGDDGYRNCPLCQMFNNDDLEYSEACAGCPVADAVNNSGCDDTPYEKWSDLSFNKGWPRMADTDEKRSVAQEELDFLILLRS